MPQGEDVFSYWRESCRIHTAVLKRLQEIDDIHIARQMFAESNSRAYRDHEQWEALMRGDPEFREKYYAYMKDLHENSDKIKALRNYIEEKKQRDNARHRPIRTAPPARRLPPKLVI